MLKLSAGAKAAIDVKSHSWATLWRMKRLDGVVFLFTDHDKRYPFNGETYLPAGGVDVSARRQQRGLNPTNVEGLGPITSDRITTIDLRKGLWRDASVTEYLVDWMYPAAGAIRTVRYWISDARWTGELWRTQLEGIARWLQARQGGLHTRNCRHDLGDGVITGIGCRVDVPTLTLYNVQMGAIIVQRLTFTAGTTVPTAHTRNRYRFGRILWTVGANKGVVQEIMDYKQLGTRIVECFFPAPFDYAATDRFDIEPGCDKIRPTCITEYNKLTDFDGFSFMPGTNGMVQHGRLTSRTPTMGTRS